MERRNPVIRGRVVAIDGDEAMVRSERTTDRALVRGGDGLTVGDIVEIDAAGNARVLTRSRRPPSFMTRVLDPRRLRGIEVRSLVEQGIREYFAAQGFRETRTPLLVPCPGMEPHIRPFRAHAYGIPETDTPAFLPTSPEFAMKRLLVGGLERIFQMTPVFRHEPTSPCHSPEFTMLEWYRAFAGYEEIMQDVEGLLAHLARTIAGKESIAFQGREISVAPPWPRLDVRDLFREHAGVDLVRADLRAECDRLGLHHESRDTWDDLYFRIWLAVVEPRLPSDRAVIVKRYPASQAALAVVDEDPDGSRWARRFEVYGGGLELGNAFEELTDPAEQRRRFESDMELRERVYGPGFPKTPLDEEFLAALEEGMPPSGGIAMGVDRIAMLFADEPDVDFLLWLKSYDPTPSAP